MLRDKTFFFRKAALSHESPITRIICYMLQITHSVKDLKCKVCREKNSAPGKYFIWLNIKGEKIRNLFSYNVLLFKKQFAYHWYREQMHWRLNCQDQSLIWKNNNNISLNENLIAKRSSDIVSLSLFLSSIDKLRKIENLKLRNKNSNYGLSSWTCHRN